MNSQEPLVSGVEHPHILDAIARGPGADEVTLILRETRLWNGSDEQLFQLQEKLNAYLSFVLDGEMAEIFPDLAQKRIRLQVDCVSMPDERTLQFLSYVREQVALQEIELEMRVVEEQCRSCDCAVPRSEIST